MVDEKISPILLLYNEAANILAMSIGWRVEKGIFRVCELGFSSPVSENS
jgi:hypothetical protein